MWAHTVCDLLCLASFIQDNVFEVHLPGSCVSASFLFMV